jgi:FecR protein
MKLSRLKMFGSFFLAVILSAPAWGTKTDAHSALPGTLNYVEGQASIGTQTLDRRSLGSAELQSGQELNTENGKAEILLTPGVFLRLGENSSAKMISPSLTNTEVNLAKGEALVEVAEIHPENDIRISANGATTRLLKTGLYDFDAARDQVRVFDGKASVEDGDRQVTVKGGREVDLNARGKLKAQKFDKKPVEASDLYRWSRLRSSYLSEANVDAARVYVTNGWYGPSWIGAGWYWDPWFGYTFIPTNGVFYSPFGWGFYAPLVVYRAPVIVGGGFYHHFGPGYRPVYAYHVGGVPHGHVSMPRPGAMAPHAAAMGPRASAGFHGTGFGGRSREFL